MSKHNGQSLTLQLIREEQHMETLRHVEESKRDESLRTMDARLEMDRQAVAAMSGGLDLMRQLNLREIAGSETDVVNIEQLDREQVEMSRDLQKTMQKREEAKMKERDQKKAAAQRLASSTDYHQPAARQLTAARDFYINHAKENPITETDWKKVEVPLSGNEFSPDPHTGEVDAASILEKQRILQAKVKLFENAKKNGTITPDEEILMETNKDILKLFTNAAGLWFTAGGVDVANGKSLSDSKKKSAQKDLGFALEKYQEFMASINDTLGERYLGRFQKAHKKELERATKEAGDTNREETKNLTGLDLNLPRLCRDDIGRIRRMTEEHPDKYQENKALVDKIYQEYLSTAEAYSNQTQPLQQMQDMLRQENNNAIAHNSMADYADRYLDKKKAELSTYQKRMELQVAALSSLLAGRETGNLISAVYMKQQWGISSKILESAEGDAGIFKETKSKLLDNAPEGITDGERQFREELVTKYMSLLNEARRDAENAPDDSGAANRYMLLKRAGLSPNIANLNNAVNRVTNERLMRKQAVQKQFGALMFKNKDGQEFSMPSNAYTRDTVNMLTPLLGETAYSIEEMTEIQDRIYCLTSGMHLDQHKATEEEKKAAFLPEYERILQTAAETKAFADAHGEAFHNPEMSHEERLRMLSLFQETYQKMQTLCYVSIKYYEYAEGEFRALLTDEQRAALADAYEVFRCVQDVSNDAVIAANSRTEPNAKEYENGSKNARDRLAQIRDKAAPKPAPEAGN